MSNLSMPDRQRMERAVAGLPTKSSKIKALARAGYPRAEIARFLDIRYQHVRNVLLREQEKLLREQEKAAMPSSAEVRQQDRVWCKIGPGGRIVVPAPYRDALGLSEGSDVQVRLEEGEVRIVPRDVVVRRVQELVGKYIPQDVSLVDDLIAERRREAERE